MIWELPLGLLNDDETHRITKGAVVKRIVSLILVAECNRLKRCHVTSSKIGWQWRENHLSLVDFIPSFTNLICIM